MRGLTLVEMLLSLALLAMILIVTASWLQTSAAMANGSMEPERANRAAYAVLQLIADDLNSHELEIDSAGAVPKERVACRDGVLTIRTRAPGIGLVERRYSLVPQSGTLELIEGDDSHPGAGGRLLLNGVAAFDCMIDRESSVLTVTLRLKAISERTLSRRYVLP